MDRPLTPRVLSNNFCFSVLCGLLILGLLCVQSVGTTKSSSCDLRRQFPCRTAPHICIDISRVRDGRSDCPDGSDEECPEGMYRCVCGLPRCIERNKVGDGIKHCQDGSDEGEDGSNYLCPESSSEENLFAVEMKKRRRRATGNRNDPVVYPTGLISTFVGTEVNGDQTTLHTTHRYRTYVDGSYTELLQSTSMVVPTPTLDVMSEVETTANVQKFGSLNSGKVYLTAMNEPVSAMSSNSERPIEVTGTFIPPQGNENTKHFGLDLQAQTVGILIPEKTGPSIITVTGTKGTFISADSTSDRTFPVYTGSYVSGQESPTTYKFFFGNQPLTSNVQVIIPTTTIEGNDFTERFDAEESELQSSITKREDNANLLIHSSLEKEIPEPYYRSENRSDLYRETIPTSRQETHRAAVTRFVQPTAYPETDEPVFAVAGRNTIGIVGNIRKPPQQTSTLRGHDGYYRQGRMYNPSPSGRRIGSQGSTIVTDQYFFPGNKVEKVPADDDAEDKDVDNAYYDINGAKLKDELRNIVKPTTSYGRNTVKDYRLTRTVGLYGPIYELDDLQTNTADVKSLDALQSSRSFGDAETEPSADFTTTLYGFAEFSTKISGTHYIFLPASTRPRTFTPRVTRTSFTNGIPIIPRSQSVSSKVDIITESFFRKPLLGTETREYVSQNSMFTSTVSEPSEISKTMITSTVNTRQFSNEFARPRKVEDFVTTSVIAETLPLNLATVYERESKSTRHSDERNLFSFKPMKNHDYMTSSLTNLEISEIVDVEESSISAQPTYPTGLVSSITGTEISEGTTTHWTTLIFGTYIDNTYAHVIESTSSIFYTVSKTMNPEETLAMEVTENDESFSDTLSNGLREEKSFNLRNSIELHSSLSDLSSKTTLTNEKTSQVLATPTLEILTSGFILPTNEYSEEYDVTSSLFNLGVSTDSTPEIMYVEENAKETESEDEPVHILTDSFILPGGIDITPSSTVEKNSELKSEANYEMKSQVSSTYLNDLDRLITGLSVKDNDNKGSSINGVSDTEINTNENEKSSGERDTSSKIVFLTGDFILPKNVKGNDLSSTPSETDKPISPEMSTSILTGDFILPNTPSQDESEKISIDSSGPLLSSSMRSSSILTEGFILPSYNLLETQSSSLSGEITPTSSSTLSILTDGFILPGLNGERNSFDASTPTPNALPSSALLTAEYPLNEDFNEIGGRSAGDDEKKIAYDDLVPADSFPHNAENSTLRNGKALFSVKESVNKPKPDQILHSIAFPITYYTTSTYFTTYLLEGSTAVSSRKETVSNVYTDSEQLKLAKINPTETIIMPYSIEPTKTENPNDYLTTFTYYTTFYKDGTKIVTSRVETEGSSVKETPTPVIESQPLYSVLTYPTTYYTTLTYFTTLLRGSSSEVISSETVVSNVVTPVIGSKSDIQPSLLLTTTSKNVQTPTTYFTTYTYYTTFHKDGTTSVSTNYQTVSNVIYGKENIVSTPVSSSVFKTEAPEQNENYIPTTYFTTYTYYTTYLRAGTPLVSSREETVTSVGSKKMTDPVSLTSSRLSSSDSPKETTYYTTYTYYTTLLKDGTTTVSTRKETVSNVLSGTSSISTTPLIVRTDSPASTIIPSAQERTYFTTYTYYTTFLRDGTPQVSTRESTVTNVVTDSAYSAIPSTVSPTRSFATYFTTLTSYYTLFNAGIPSVSTVYSTLTDIVALETPAQNVKPTTFINSISSTPITTTYYTTYTYFTTLLNSGTPEVTTKEIVKSNIVTLMNTESITTARTAITPFSLLDSQQIQPTAVLTKTLYTTYTFYSTYFFPQGTPSVSTRLETATSYVTETITRTQNQFIGTTPYLTSHFSSTVRGSFSETDSFSHIDPTNVHSSATFYTAPINGDVLDTKTNTGVISSIFDQSETLKNQNEDKSLIVPSIAVNTIYTTFTYYTTLFPNGTPLIQTRYETKSNMITLTISPTKTEKITITTSDLEAAEGGLHENRVHPTPVVTYYSTHTYLTTSIKPNGETSYITRKVVATATIEQDEKKKTELEPSTLETVIYPYTFYTTYTYYTTRFHGNNPIINTRYETITNVIKAPVTAPIVSETKIITSYDSTTALYSKNINDIEPTSTSQFITTSEASAVFFSIPGHEPWSENKSRKDDESNNSTTNENNDEHPNTENDIDVENTISTYPVSNVSVTTESSYTHSNLTEKNSAILTVTEPTPIEKIESAVFINKLEDVLPVSESSSTENPSESTADTLDRETEITTADSSTTEIATSEAATVSETENKTEAETTTELTSSTTTTVAPTIRSIFSRRRNRPQYKPRPSFRSTTTTTPRSTTLPSRSPNRAITTSKPPVIGRRNATRLFYRRPSLAPRVNPLQRFRPKTTPSSTEVENNNRRRKRSFFRVDEDYEEMPRNRKILSTSEENNETLLKNNDLISENTNADRRNNEKENYPVGLIKSMEAKAISNGVTTVYATEIHGTFINGVYAQVVQSKVKLISDTSNEIERTPFFPSPVPSPTLERRSETQTNKVGLVSSKLSTLVKDQTTTVYTTNIYGTYIGEVYAHLAQTTSNIITPTPTQNSYPTGLISSLTRSEENYGTTTLWTTHIYGTYVNNYYAHIASTFSNVFVAPDKSTPLFTQSTNQYAQATPDLRTSTPTARSIDTAREYPTGLLSSIVSEEDRDGTTTQFITNIYGTYIGEHYAKHAQTTSKVIQPTKTYENSQTRSVGLLSTLANSIINGNTATIYKTEIYGTYIGQLYAQLARTSTEYSYVPKSTSSVTTPQVIHKTGLLSSSIVRSEINAGTTTMHINEVYGTYIGNAYAHVAKSTYKVIKPTLAESKTSMSDSGQKTGLISSSVKTEVNDGTTTLHIAEVHGTYVGNYYAHVARRTSTVLPIVPTSTSAFEEKQTSTTTTKSDGLISSEVRTEVNQGVTTLHTREIYGTHINGFYAHVARSSSNIITPTLSSSSTNSGLVSAITNTEINDGLTTLHTTEIFGTSINGFYAHIARSTSNVISPSPTSRPVGIISTTVSTEINNDGTTLHRTSLIGLDFDGTYTQSIKVTSTVIYASPFYLESLIKPTFVQETKTSHLGTAKDDLDTARVNELDNGNQYISLTEDSDLGKKSPLTLPTDTELLSPSVVSENTVTELETVTDVVTVNTSSVNALDLKNLFTSNDFNSESVSETSKANLEKSKIEEPTKSIKKEEKTSKDPSDDYNDYNDYADNKAFKDKESITLKPNVRDQNLRKNKAPSLASSRKIDPEEDYDEYAFEDDYGNFESRKFNRKPTPSLASSRFKNTRESKRKSATIGNGDYDDYDDYDYHDSETASEETSKSTETSTPKESTTSSVRIRPFTGRGRITYTTPSRSSTKSSFTIQFRRPSRTRNSRAFGHRSDSENDFDDDLHEDDEGDIEASEAVVTTATPQALSFTRRKPFGSSRYQPPARNSAVSSTTRPAASGRNRRPFGRTNAGNPSPTPSIKDSIPDYDENTTEDDDFDDYEDFSDKKDFNKGSRNFRSTRRPPSRVTRFGERRSASNKRGSFRHREEEETENDDFDATTPNYRNSRNRINQRKPSRGRYNRNNSPLLKSSFNSVSRDEEEEDSDSLQPINRVRGNNRRGRPSYNPRTRRPSKTVTETPTIRKPYLTVTSVVTTVKTLPIYHGFRTSYATLTTTALDTSIINPTQYSEVVSDGVTKTVFYSKTGYPDGIENHHTTVTEVVVTTTSLASIKLVPIKIGFSTRTDTVTDIQVLTTLSTVYSTITPDNPQPTAFPQQFQPNFYPQLGPQNPDFGLLAASANSFVTTQIVTSTTVVPIILRGRTILSTLTTTSTSESTVVQTVRLPQVPSPAPFIPQPYFAFQPLTTLLTLYVTGEHGELKPVVTTVTVPLYQQPVFHTKVARSLQQNAISEHTLKTADFMDLPLSSSISHEYSREIDIDTHYDKLLSSGLEEINDLSEKSSSQTQTEPLDSTRITKIPYGMTTYDVTTISKGPLTEIYEQKVTVNVNTDDESMKQNEIERSKDIYGLESRYSFRKLQQFVEEEPVFRPQRDFTRIRRPPPGIILATVSNPIGISQPNTQSVPVRVRPRQFPPARRPPVVEFNEETSDQGDLRNGFRGSTFSRRPLRRPEGNFRPFIERPSEVLPPTNDEFNSVIPFAVPGVELNNIVPSAVSLENSRTLTSGSGFEPVRLQSTNGNVNNLNRFIESPNVDENNEEFTPISNGQGLRRGPGPALNELPEGSLRSRRLRITRPLSGDVTSGVVRRITRLRSSIVATPISTASDFGIISPSVSSTLESSSYLPTTNERHIVTDNLEESEAENDEHDEENLTTRRTVIRRLRPSFIPGDGSGGRRPVVVRRTRVNEKSTSTIPNPEVSTSEISTSNPVPVSVTIIDDSTTETLRTDTTDDENETNTDGASKPPLKKIVRLRKPENADQIPPGSRRRVVISRRPQDVAASNTVQGRGPVNFIETTEEKQRNNIIADKNHLVPDTEYDIDDLNKIATVPSRNLGHNSVYSTKVYPITYFTTLTYFTTFVHGPEINYGSRVAVFSNIIEHTLNPSIINAIRLNKQQPTKVSTVHLASRTLGDTTTIVNLASYQNVYNSEIDKLLDEEITRKFTPTALVSGVTKDVSLDTSNINVLAPLPKTYLTLFTYSYTFFDGINSRESTRAETMTKVNNDPSQFLSMTVGPTIDKNGLLDILPVTRTLHLGSRELEGTTTEVNLGLKTLIKFGNIKNVLLETAQPFQYITPTRTYATVEATSTVETPKSSTMNIPSYVSLDSSYSSANELYGVNSNQDISSGTTPLVSDGLSLAEHSDDKRPIIKVTSVVHKPVGPLRSGVFNPRPGVRVRVKPVASRRVVPSELLSSFDISFDVNDIASEYLGEVPVSPQFIPPSVNVGAIATPVLEDSFLTSMMSSDVPGVDNELVAEDFDEEVPKTDGAILPPRKKLKVTVRRPQSESMSRTHTRFVLPSRFEITSRPRFYVVTRTGALGVVSNTQRPFTVKISRKLKPTSIEEIQPSTTVIYDTYTTLTSVPVIFGLETSFRNVLLTTSSPITVSFVPSPTFESDSAVVMPSTVVLTYFTTTTFTIPYLVDDKTLFTTVEETNSRVVTSTLDIPGSSADAPSAFTPSAAIPTLSLLTSIEFGFDGPVTHTLSSHNVYEEPPPSPIVTIYETPTSTRYEAKTFYTTYTFFTTLFAGTEPVVSSSEQVVTNVITVPVTTEVSSASPAVNKALGPVTVFDTSENIITKTSYKTVTFYATLFSDTSSFVTPIEEVQTDLSTITETFTITRTILPTPSATFVPFVTETRSFAEEIPFVPQPEPSVVVTQTLYTTFTNFVTLFQGIDTVVTNLEEIVSNVVTMTVPAHAASSFITSTPTSTTETFKTMAPESSSIYTTKEVISTQTHYLTLFNNGESLLSSIEEIVTKYVTELVTALTPSYPSYTSYTSYAPETDATSSPDYTFISSNLLLPSSQLFSPFSSTSETIEEKTSEISTYHPELVPSIRTIYSTLTFYTTYYSDTSSIVATQEEVLTSYVTLFVPPSLITTTTDTTSVDIKPTSTTDPSIFVFTTTDYSTLTLYTTLFSGDEIVVISSEHVVPEIITATITPTSTTPAETSTKDESVLTFLTTFTYYTTYFSGTDPVIASSESVVTQFVTIEAPPTSTSFTETSIESTPVEETIIGVSTASVANVISSIDDISSSIEIIEVSSAVATGSEIVSSIETKVQVESKVHTEIGFTPALASPTLLTTEIDDSSSPSESIKIIESETISSEITTKHSESTQSAILPITTSSILNEKTEIVGLDGLITSLAPSDTLLMVTGTDGFITKLAELDTGALSPVYVPSTEQISSTSTSEIKPATVIELSDLLGGNTALGGDIGLAIKDIVSLITGKKNKTEEGVTTENMMDSSTKATEEPLDTTTEITTEKGTPETIPDSGTEKDDDVDVSKDLDYPIFVLPGKDTESKTLSDILAPVYVPTESIRSTKSELSVTKSMTSSREEISRSKISKSVTTSVITGARTVFIIPTKATSVVDSNKDKYTIEPRQPKIDTSIESSSTRSKVEKEVKTLITDFILPTPSSSANKETRDPSDSILKITTHSSDIKELSKGEQPEEDLKPVIVSSLSLLPKESSKVTTPELKPSLGTSVISGIRTVFFDPSLPKTSKSQLNTISPSEKEEIAGRANTGSSSAKPFTTVTKDGQTVISRSTSGATTIFFPEQIPKYTVPVISTSYITSVETITRTLALTTTRTYYTRDSTLTVPSVYTTTIPPRTFVSTIIGSRTILGILPEPTETVQIHKTLEPSERTTTVTTTTLIFNSIPSTVIRTLVLPTGPPTKTFKSDTSSSYTVSDSDIFSAGTERPAKPPEVGDSTAIANEDLNDEKLSAVKSVQKARDETYLRAANPRIYDQHPDNRLQEARRPPIVVTEATRPEDDPFLNGRNGVCDPKCQPYKKEICKEKDGFWSCQCRPGHARRDDHEICKEIQTFVVLLKVVKNGNQSIEYNEGLADNDSKEFKEFVKSAREGIADAYSITNVREHIYDAEVNHILPSGGMKQTDDTNEVTTVIPEQGVIVNFTMQVSKSVSSDLLEQELTRALQLTHMQVGDSALLAAPLTQSVQDYDECLDGRQNDCSLRATCINLPGTFACKCNEGFEDMDSNLPGRSCLAKTENCNYCHGRGDCLRDDDDKTFCRCQPMFVGRRCEINGLVLAVALPTAVAVVVLLLCAVLCCCRKCKRKSPTPNNADPGSVFRGIALKGPVGSTLDRKAMIDTSSESSGEHGRKGPFPLEGYQESGDVTPHKSSKRSDLSLNRSLSTGYTTAPVMIPRAKQPQIPNKPMNYTVYDGQVYVW